MPSYVITLNGRALHISDQGRIGRTLCGLRAGWPPGTDIPRALGRRHCTHCLDRAARMSKREE